MNENVKNSIKSILTIITITLLGALSIIFATLYIETFTEGFIQQYALPLEIGATTIVIVLTALTVLFYRLNKELIYKCGYVVIVFIACALILLYVLVKIGFFDIIETKEDLREYVKSFGNFAVVLFLTLQLLQVTVLPIPAFVTIGAGAMLFGPLWGAVLSFVGIVLGSFVNFFIGRYFGYKVAAWMVGKDTLDKAIESVKGKDKIILTFMFLFPFFPDDVLCFVSGLSTMSVKFYAIMIVITRLISIFVSSYAYDGALIPYNTWWGLLLWGLVFIAVALLTYVIYKNGEKIEKFFKDKFSRKRNG